MLRLSGANDNVADGQLSQPNQTGRGLLVLAARSSDETQKLKPYDPAQLFANTQMENDHQQTHSCASYGIMQISKHQLNDCKKVGGQMLITVERSMV